MSLEDHLLQKARPEGTPLIDGGRVTFVWEGEEDVELGADFCGWKPGETVPMVQAGPCIWTYQIELPPNAYIEYCYFQKGQRKLDPLNARRTPNGLGYTNNYFYMQQAHPSRLAYHPRSGPPLRILTEEVDTAEWFSSKTRKVHFWQPPVDVPCPLLVVFDGREHLRRANLPEVVNNLLTERRIRPLALALLENNRAGRTVEYAANDATLLFISECLLPLARSRMNLTDTQAQPGDYGVVGASMGGLMALYLGLRLPSVFGSVLSQGGAFTIEQYDLVVYDLVRQFDSPGLRVWLDCGIYDTLLATNQRMEDLLIEQGFETDLHLFPAGHNFPAWRDNIHYGLEWLFPPDKT